MTEFSLKIINLPKKLYRISDNKNNFDLNLKYFLNKKSILPLRNIRNLKQDYFNIKMNSKVIDFTNLF